MPVRRTGEQGTSSMLNRWIDRAFLAHPHAMGESYFEHLAFACWFSGRLFRAAAAALLHALVPCLCRTTASDTILGMQDAIARRRAAMNAKPGLSAVPLPE